MQVEFGRFLNEIKVKPEVYSYFSTITLLEAKYLKKRNIYHLVLQSNYVVDVAMFEELEKSAKTFRYPCEFEIKIINENSVNDLAVNAYYLYFVKKYFSDSFLFAALSRIKLIIANQQIMMYVSSITLQDAIGEYQNIFRKAFAAAGFTTPFIIELKERTTEEVEELMAKEKARMLEESRQFSITQANDSSQDKYKSKYINNRVKEVTLKTPLEVGSTIIFNARIFQIEVFTRKEKPPIYSIYVTDDEDSVILKVSEGAKFDHNFLSQLKEDDYIRVRGLVVDDLFAHDIVVRPSKIELIPDPNPRSDDEPIKRIELHLHSNYSPMDGVCEMGKYVKQAAKFGHSAIAVTDHGCVQGFPEAQSAGKDNNIKILYGMEGYLVEDSYIPVYNEKDLELSKATYVAFDLETTGLSPRHDEIIEIGAVKIQAGLVIDEFSTFINPKKRLSKFVSDLSGITDEDLLEAPLLEEVATNFIKFVGDAILVAHNATFDYNMINEAFIKRGFKPFSNCVIDTLDLSRCLLKLKSYSLGAVCRKLNVQYIEDSAHRANYDARVLGELLVVLIQQMYKDFKIDNLKQINSLSPKDAYIQKHPYHVTMLVQDEIGLKNLYRIVTESSVKYFNYVPLIPRQLLMANRGHILVGSACFNGEVFDMAHTASENKLRETMKFYDYIEIQPLANYSYLIDTQSIENAEALKTILLDIIAAAEKENKIIVATGDCHYLNPRDKIYRDAYIVYRAKANAAGHPLYDYKHRVKSNPDQHFRTTKEMLDGLSFLGEEKAREYVITNTHKIADMISANIHPIKEGTSVPKLPGLDSDKEIEKLCFDRAKALYGDPIPAVVLERFTKELKNLIDNKYTIIYYLAVQLIKKSNEAGYLVGSRGSVGSSFVATLCGITEVNPLKPHYICPNCHHFEMVEDDSYASGYDLPAKLCPECGHMMNSDGQNIPFETFLGFHGDKVPDIDLNFASEYQPLAHLHTRELLDDTHAFRAGTISAVADKTSYGVAKHYFESLGINDERKAQTSRLAHGCSGVKKTTGQHPGGIVIVPLEQDVLDFTPVQYPSNDVKKEWLITHFPYEMMHDELLKLDILSHEDPTALKMLKELTGYEPLEIPLNDPKVLSLFISTEALGLTPYQCFSMTGVSGVPEFGTENTKRILADARPTKFSELVQISGLSHGTGVWNGNAQDLIKSKQASLMEVIGCRDDVMSYLISKGLDKKNAFDIMENVRKKNKNITKEQEADMRSHGVPEFYIQSAKKIEYMFPKAHAVAYVSMALRIAWYKVYYPFEYYATFFSVRCEAYDIEAMIAGGEVLKEALRRTAEQMNDRTLPARDRGNATKLYDVLLLAVEFNARGYSFANISIKHSDAKNFVIDYEKNRLYPPFKTIKGFSDESSAAIVKAREKHMFESKQDLLNRSKINHSQLQSLEDMHVLDELDNEDQLSLNLFD